MFQSQISKFTITNSWCLDPCLSKIFISAGFQRFYNFYFCWKEGIFLIKTCQRFDKKHGVYIRIDQCWVDGSLIIMEGPNRTTGLIQKTNSESKKIAFVYNLQIISQFLSIFYNNLLQRYVADFMMVTVCRCWWQNCNIGDFFDIGNVLNVINRSPASKSRHQVGAINTFCLQHESPTSM